ncbi:MAG: hypothetical protein A3H91_00970 [Gammaproteobacteria bacterium RIFCSPLOWO2_02_FULL_61_13]|nr:MAG: hypothetical protein A3H91_00970 [Gammaproteobacteria bacterium RIFCSPLOWO2_02_FULL_61_13]
MPRTALALLILVFLPAATAWDGAAGEVYLRCDQPDLQILRCDYRSLTGVEATLALHTAGGSVPPRERTAFPWPEAKTALLFLLDTSDPGRAAIVEQNIRQVASLAQAARPHYRLGLARFDKELEVLAPLGSPAGVVASAAQRLRAIGMTTELYRNLQQAVDLLVATEAERRFIVVFSDGQAEDTAYYHEDVVGAARRGGISIVSLGFPRSVARSVALQSLRRLSHETGGVYLEAGLNGTLPDGFERQILASTDSGGRVTFALPGPGADEQAPVAKLVVRTATRESRVEIPLRLPPPPRVSAPPTAAATPASPAIAPVPVTPLPGRSGDRWLWYAVPAALTILILLALMTLYLLFRRPGKSPDARHSAAPELKPFAYLISQTSHPKRYAITSAIWRIGRSRENEMALDDVSISRRHAEIQRGADGAFTLLDRGSRNGTFINGQQVKKRTLQEGDMIEVGDVVLRFTESGADEQLQEQTAIQHTRQPRSG